MFLLYTSATFSRSVDICSAGQFSIFGRHSNQDRWNHVLSSLCEKEWRLHRGILYVSLIFCNVTKPIFNIALLIVALPNFCRCSHNEFLSIEFFECFSECDLFCILASCESSDPRLNTVTKVIKCNMILILWPSSVCFSSMKNYLFLF